jgi:glutaredoxin
VTSRGALLIVLLAAAALPGAAPAQAYSWTDKDGTVHFGDEPPADGQKARRIDLAPDDPPPPPAAPAAGAARSPAGEGTGRPPASRPSGRGDAPPARPKATPRVELFSTGWCPWCQKAREFFRSRGIAITDLDIDADPAALARKLRLDGDQRVPTAVIGNVVVRGYAPERYQAALDRP